MTTRLIMTVAAWLFAATAAAHPSIDLAVERIDGADFEGALEAFTEAEQASDLSRSDLATLFARRAAVHFALSNEVEAREDLARLAALEPNYVFGVWAAPNVRAAFEEVRSGARPVELRTEVTEEDGQIILHAGVSGDPGGLVRNIFFSTRDLGTRSWTRAAGAVRSLPTGSYEYFAEAVANGEVVVARVGSRSAPLRAGESVSTVAAPVLPGPDEDPEEDSDGSAIYWALGLTAGAAAIAAVVIAILVTSSSSDDGQTMVGAPMVTFR